MSESSHPMSFTLGAHERAFISEQVSEGRFGNRTEVVRAGLRLLQDYENHQKLQRLRGEIALGDADVEAGRFTEYDNAESLMADLFEEGRES